MRLVLSIVLRDLLRRRRSPATTLTLLAFPIVLSLVFGLAFGRQNAEKMPPLELLLADEDGTLLSKAMGAGKLAKGFGDRITLRPVTRAEGEALLAKGEGNALLLIRKGFSGNLLAGRPDTLFLWRNPGESIMPYVAEEMAHAAATGLSAASAVLREPLAELQRAFSAEEAPADATVASIAVGINRARAELDPYIDPVLVKPVKPAPGDPAGADSLAAGRGARITGSMGVALYVLPGISVMALLMVAQSAMRDLLREERLGTLRRMLATPATMRTILVAKIAGAMAVAMIGLVVLTIVAAAWGAPAVDPAAFVLISTAFVVSACGVVSLVYGLMRTERQGQTVSEVVIMVMAFAGGSWVPLEALPDTMRVIAPYTINYWAGEGYKQLLFEGANLADLGPNVAILAAAGTVTILCGALLLQRRLSRGG